MDGFEMTDIKDSRKREMGYRIPTLVPPSPTEDVHFLTNFPGLCVCVCKASAR